VQLASEPFARLCAAGELALLDRALLVWLLAEANRRRAWRRSRTGPPVVTIGSVQALAGDLGLERRRLTRLLDRLVDAGAVQWSAGAAAVTVTAYDALVADGRRDLGPVVQLRHQAADELLAEVGFEPWALLVSLAVEVGWATSTLEGGFRALADRLGCSYHYAARLLARLVDAGHAVRARGRVELVAYRRLVQVVMPTGRPRVDRQQPRVNRQPDRAPSANDRASTAHGPGLFPAVHQHLEINTNTPPQPPQPRQPARDEREAGGEAVVVDIEENPAPPLAAGVVVDQHHRHEPERVDAQLAGPPPPPATLIELLADDPADLFRRRLPADEIAELRALVTAGTGAVPTLVAELAALEASGWAPAELASRLVKEWPRHGAAFPARLLLWRARDLPPEPPVVESTLERIERLMADPPFGKAAGRCGRCDGRGHLVDELDPATNTVPRCPECAAPAAEAAPEEAA
jgi:DNA-binding MarR family transcriptional regulator